MWIVWASLVILAYLGMNIYTGIRVFDSLNYFYFLPSAIRFIFWPVYMALCNSMTLVMLLRLDRISFLRRASMYALPFSAYFFFPLIALDAMRLGLQHLGMINPAPSLPAFLTGLAIGIAILFMIYGTFRAKKIQTVDYGIRIGKSAGQLSALRIALISDLHIGVTIDKKWIANIVGTVNKAEPDIILMAGDIFDSDINAVKDLEGVAQELKGLKAPLGVFASQGNHDVDEIVWRASPAREVSTEKIEAVLASAGITFLLDEVILVANSFYIAGRRDESPIGSRHIRKTAASLIEGIDTSKPIIVLDHQPMDFPNLDAVGVDLILSGHTHRGQIFPANIVTKRMFKKAGSTHYGYWRGNNAAAVITSGVGIWGPTVRIGSFSEVAMVNIMFS